MPRTKTLHPNLPVPQDDAAAREAIRELGQRQREVVRIQARMNDRIAAEKDRAAEAAAPHQTRITALTEGLRVWAEANRERLTGGRGKTVRLATGVISWRFRPAKVTLRAIDQVIEAIKIAGLGRHFLRVKEEVNKEALLADRETAAGLPGVSIGSDGEDFIVEPDEDLVEEARP